MMSRLTVLHINLIGVVVAAIVAAGLYFTLIPGANDAIAKAEASRKTVVDKAATLPVAKANLAKAQKDKADAERVYAVGQKQYFPLIGFTGNRMEDMIRLFWSHNGKSWPERFIRTVKQYMASQAKTNGIVWENPGVLQLGPFGPNPNTIDIAMPGEGMGEKGYLHYTFPMTVRARSLDSLMRHIQQWPIIRGAGVPVVEGLTIAGNTPNLIASYSLTLTIIVDQETPPPADNRVSGQAGGAGGGMMGGPGGMPGMMGGPGGMPGMMGGPGGMPGMMGGPGGMPGMMGGPGMMSGQSGGGKPRMAPMGGGFGSGGSGGGGAATGGPAAQ
jgi:hypothetical protein